MKEHELKLDKTETSIPGHIVLNWKENKHRDKRIIGTGPSQFGYHNLYNKQVAYVRIGDSFRKATDNLDIGFSVGGHTMNTIRYADDKVVVANSQKELNPTNGQPE